MKAKKSEKANLEKKRSLFLQIGLLISLCLSLAAFEWSAKVEQKLISNNDFDRIEVEEPIKIIREKKEEPKPKPKPKEKDFSKIEKISNESEKDDTEEIIENLSSEIDSITPYIEPEEEEEEDVVPVPDLMPVFNMKNILKKNKKIKYREQIDNKLSEAEFQKWLYNNLTYPHEAAKFELEGRVIAQFIINKKGKLTNVKIVRGVDPLLDNQVIKTLEQSPYWTPGEKGGKKVKVIFTIPVKFEMPPK